jgi:hypothetical protein
MVRWEDQSFLVDGMMDAVDYAGAAVAMEGSRAGGNRLLLFAFLFFNAWSANLVVLAVLHQFDMESVLLSAFLTAGFALLIGLFLRLRPSRQEQYRVKYLDALGENAIALRVTADAEGIVRFLQHSVLSVRWAGVRKTERIGDYVVIRVSSLQYISLPLRFFSGEAQIQEFVHTLERWRSASIASAANADSTPGLST